MSHPPTINNSSSNREPTKKNLKYTTSTLGASGSTTTTPITPSPIRCAIPITTNMPSSLPLPSSSSTSSSSPKLPLIPDPDPEPDLLAFDSTLDAHLRSLESQGKLVDILRSAWTMQNTNNSNTNTNTTTTNNNNNTMKEYILSQVKDTSWMIVEDSDSKLLQYDWEIVNGLDEYGYGKDNKTDENEDEDPLLLKFASNQVRLGMESNYGRDDVDVSQICGGYYGVGYQGGGACPYHNHHTCQGDEIYHFQMQTNFYGTVRLRIQEYQTCTCDSNGTVDDDDDNSGASDTSGSHMEIEDESNYYVAYQCKNGKLSSSSSSSLLCKS